MPNETKSMMDATFARVYEAEAERITGPISHAALQMVGNIGPGVRLLDIAAGTGALSVPAAEMGAEVLATDIATGMVERLKERLKPFPNCEARMANGEHLELPDASFEAAFSIFGVILFSDWRTGLRELARVVKDGSHSLEVCCPRFSRACVGAAILLVLSHLAVSQALSHAGDVRVVRAHLIRDGQPWTPHGFHQIAFAVAPGGLHAVPPFFNVASENYSPQEYTEMKEHGADSVRIQVAQNGIDPDGMHYVPEFRTRVVSAVREARSAGLVVISIQNEEQTGQLQKDAELPSDATKRVWDIFAPIFKEDRGVMYEVFNEPRIRPMPPQGPTSEQWRRWAAAMNRMIQVVRSYGADNVVVADGLQRAETLHGAPPLDDPLRQVIYASHPYAHSAQDQCPDA